MKNPHRNERSERRDELRAEQVHDAYKAREKLPEPTVCPDCGAVYEGGRWTWSGAPQGAHRTRCPACRRTHDRYPVGYVTLAGGFYEQHREEVLNLVKNCEAREKAEHPMERIIAIEDQPEGTVVTTTSAHVARRIADGLHNAWKGTLDLHYNKQQELFRARWTRER